MQTKYNIYNTQSTSSYFNNMLLVGVLATSSMGSSYGIHTGFIDSLSYEHTHFSANQTALKNETQNIVQDAHKQIMASNFEFLQVDEKLDKEIDSYLARYNGTEKEILDI